MWAWREDGHGMPCPYEQKKTAVMGILNLTPDSFSDGRPGASHADFLKQAENLIVQGADILDIGGESTRPGAESVNFSEEKKRVFGFLDLFRKKYPDFPISLDTKKFEVAREALSYKISILNDVSFLADIRLAELARDSGCYYVLMHSRGDSKSMMRLTNYPGGILSDTKSEILSKIHDLNSLNFPTTKLILDPGFGFAKTPEDCVLLMNHLAEWCATWHDLGIKLLFAISRKRFLQNYTGENLPEDRDVVSAELSVKAVDAGFKIIRTHRPDLTLKTLKMINKGNR